MTRGKNKALVGLDVWFLASVPVVAFAVYANIAAGLSPETAAAWHQFGPPWPVFTGNLIGCLNVLICLVWADRILTGGRRLGWVAAVLLGAPLGPSAFWFARMRRAMRRALGGGRHASPADADGTLPVGPKAAALLWGALVAWHALLLVGCLVFITAAALTGSLQPDLPALLGEPVAAIAEVAVGLIGTFCYFVVLYFAYCIYSRSRQDVTGFGRVLALWWILAVPVYGLWYLRKFLSASRLVDYAARKA